MDNKADLLAQLARLHEKAERFGSAESAECADHAEDINRRLDDVLQLIHRGDDETP